MQPHPSLLKAIRLSLTLTLALALPGLTLSVQAQSESPVSTTDGAPNADAEGAEVKTSQTQGEADNSERIMVSGNPGGTRFEPSEEVSEDLSVGFPADI